MYRVIKYVWDYPSIVITANHSGYIMDLTIPIMSLEVGELLLEDIFSRVYKGDILEFERVDSLDETTVLYIDSTEGEVD